MLRHALAGQSGAPTEPLVVPDGSHRWRVDLETLARIVNEVRREQPPYLAGRERVRALWSR